MSLLDKLADPKLIKSCWRDIYNGKSEEKRAHSKGIDNISLAEFKNKETYYLQQILLLLQKKKYKLGKLRGYLEPKETKGEFRLIGVANVSDRIVHKAILVLINPFIYPYINTEVSYCGVKKEILGNKKDSSTLNTKAAIKKLIVHIKNGNYWIFKTDIKKFYDNVPKRRLNNIIKEIFKDTVKDTSLSDLITKIIFFHLANKEICSGKNEKYMPDKYKGISQGSPLSQIFANVYLAWFDDKMKKRYGKRFIRYIDDYIVMCSAKDEAKKAERYSKALLKKIGLDLSDNPKKTYIVNLQKDSLHFLGLRLDKEKITTKKTKDQQSKWIKDVLNEHNTKYYRNNKKLSKKIRHMNDIIQGFGNYIRYYHPEDAFKLINKEIKHKKHNKKFATLKNLKLSLISPVIPILDWQSFF